MYAVTRAIAWLVGTVHVPLPLNRFMLSGTSYVKIYRVACKPYVYICVIERAALS